MKSKDKNNYETEKLRKRSDEFRIKMEKISLQIRDLILAQPPIQLLGYLWAQFHMKVLFHLDQDGEDYRPDKELISEFQFALEYIHAVWSCHANLANNDTQLDETKVKLLFETLNELKNITMLYCMASSIKTDKSQESRGLSDMEFHAKSTWVLIRGNRYQVLEEEFLKFVLKPHRVALKIAYGMESDEIAAGIQSIANSIRSGFNAAIHTIYEYVTKATASTRDSQFELSSAIIEMIQANDKFEPEMKQAIYDMLYGGICNLSQHSNFTMPLLEDLSYLPGENEEFFADGDFVGTPLRTLPALVKPGIKLGDEYYITDGQFIRDAAYRTIQRGLLTRLPNYREQWNLQQKSLIEQSFPVIFGKQLADAIIYSEVYFRDTRTNQWAETDLVLIIDDVLLVIEAKAGVMAMHSPATNFDRHERTIRGLIVKAYEQCDRFLRYISSNVSVPLYNLAGEGYAEIARLQLRDYRMIVPIGLTVEAFVPFSSLSKELAEIQPICDRYPFVSMSVDDLFVLNRFLPTTGELLHYIAVRQEVSGISNAMLFDEIEHLGAYIENNRFDITIREQLKESDFVMWDSFGDVVDRYFENDNWASSLPPRQEFLSEVSAILDAMDRLRPSGWLKIDSHIRDWSSSARNNFSNLISDLKATLTLHPARRFIFGDDKPLQVWLCRNDFEPSHEEIKYHGQVGCLTLRVPELFLIKISYNSDGEVARLECGLIVGPLVLQSDYEELVREAERQRGRMVDVSRRSRLRPKKR